jgi:hypothetical protein
MSWRGAIQGAIAQLGERLLCKQEVAGSIPAGSTNLSRGLRRAATHASRAAHVWLRASSLRARPFFKNSEVVLTHLIQAMLMVSYHQPSFESCRIRESAPLTPGSLGLYGQANKRMWWMPRR